MWYLSVNESKCFSRTPKTHHTTKVHDTLHNRFMQAEPNKTNTKSPFPCHLSSRWAHSARSTWDSVTFYLLAASLGGYVTRSRFFTCLFLFLNRHTVPPRSATFTHHSFQRLIYRVLLCKVTEGVCFLGEWRRRCVNDGRFENYGDAVCVFRNARRALCRITECLIFIPPVMAATGIGKWTHSIQVWHSLVGNFIIVVVVKANSLGKNYEIEWGTHFERHVSKSTHANWPRVWP